eukprot:GHVH01006222.1.p1 GENE.GHVH01006222.1~~GHVH01006222.1.p1  ORF type:complete len:1023 (-),score=113.62 GHVH01006222.1:2324-5392(-)
MIIVVSSSMLTRVWLRIGKTMKSWWTYTLKSIDSNLLCFSATAYVKKDVHCCHSKIIFFGDSIDNLTVNGHSQIADASHMGLEVSIPHPPGCYLIHADYRFVLNHKSLNCAVSRETDCLIVFHHSELSPVLCWPSCGPGFTNMVVSMTTPGYRSLTSRAYSATPILPKIKAQKPENSALSAVIQFECQTMAYDLVSSFSGVWMKESMSIGECNVDNLSITVVTLKSLKVSTAAVNQFLEELQKRLGSFPQPISVSLLVHHDDMGRSGVDSGNSFVSIPRRLISTPSLWNKRAGNFSNVFAQINLHIYRIYFSGQNPTLHKWIPKFFAPLVHLPIFLDRCKSHDTVQGELGMGNADARKIAIILWLSLMHASSEESIQFCFGVPMTFFTYQTLGNIHDTETLIKMQKILNLWNNMRKVELFVFSSVSANHSIFCGKPAINHFTQKINMFEALLFDDVGLSFNENDDDSIDESFEVPLKLVVESGENDSLTISYRQWKTSINRPLDFQCNIRYAICDSSASSERDQERSESDPRTWIQGSSTQAEVTLKWPGELTFCVGRYARSLRLCVASVSSLTMSPVPCVHWENCDSPVEIANALMSLPDEFVLKTAIFALVLRHPSASPHTASFICEVLSIMMGNRNILDRRLCDVAMSPFQRTHDIIYRNALPILTANVIRGHEYPSIFEHHLPDGLFQLVKTWSKPPHITPCSVDRLIQKKQILDFRRDKQLIIYGSGTRLTTHFDIGQSIFCGPAYDQHREKLQALAKIGKTTALENEILLLLSDLSVSGAATSVDTPPSRGRHLVSEDQGESNIREKVKALAMFITKNPTEVDNIVSIAIMANPCTNDRFVFWTKLLNYVFSRKVLQRMEDVDFRFRGQRMISALDYTLLSTWILVTSLGILDTNVSEVIPQVSKFFTRIRSSFQSMLDNQIRALKLGREGNRDPETTTSLYTGHLSNYCLHHPSPLAQITEKPLFWILLNLFKDTNKLPMKDGTNSGDLSTTIEMTGSTLTVELMRLSIDDMYNE